LKIEEFVLMELNRSW